MKTEEQELIRKRYLKKLQKRHFDKAPVFCGGKNTSVGESCQSVLVSAFQIRTSEWRETWSCFLMVIKLSNGVTNCTVVLDLPLLCYICQSCQD